MDDERRKHLGPRDFVDAYAREYGTKVEDLHPGEVRFEDTRQVESLFRYPRRIPSMKIAGFGPTTAIVASDDFLSYAKTAKHTAREWFSSEAVGSISALAVRNGQKLSEITHKFVADYAAIRPVVVTQYQFEILRGREIEALYGDPAFRNAISYGNRPDRPDAYAAVAKRENRVVGVAGASEDAPDIFQIGVDVKNECRGQGIGISLVSQLASVVFDRGGLPFYSTVGSNIISRRLCLSVGFRPVCIEMYTY